MVFFQEIGKLYSQRIYENGHNKQMYVEKKPRQTKDMEMEYKQLSKEERHLHGKLVQRPYDIFHYIVKNKFEYACIVTGALINGLIMYILNKLLHIGL